jgi:hypothetical protein
MYNRRKRDAAQTEAAADQRRREDAAPLLREQAPWLDSLRLKFDMRRPGGAATPMAYARPVVVPTARAHFEVRCMEPSCDGRHDFTTPILRALRDRQTSSTTESACTGVINNMSCDRTLICVCEATYKA